MEETLIQKSIEWILDEVNKSPHHLGNLQVIRYIILTMLDLGIQIDNPFLYRLLQTLDKIDDAEDIHNPPQKCLIFSKLRKEAEYLINTAREINFETSKPDPLYISIMCTVFSEFPETFNLDLLDKAKKWLELELERNFNEKNADALSFNLVSFNKLMKNEKFYNRKKIDTWIKKLENLMVNDHWPPVNPAWGDELTTTANCIYNLIQLGVSTKSNIIQRATKWLKRQAKLNGSWKENVRVTIIVTRALIAASIDKRSIQLHFLELLKEYEFKELLNQLLAMIRNSNIENQLKLLLVTEGQVTLMQRGKIFKSKLKEFTTKIIANPEIVRLAPAIVDVATKLYSIIV